MLTTISDRKIGVYSNGSLTLPNDSVVAVVDYYEPHYVNATDYYAFGMPSRVAGSATGKEYRHGFNGMENDNEIKGFGNSLNTRYRELDVRGGRWWSIDPVTDPATSPYASMDNNPILNSDPDGDCATCPKDAKFGTRHSEKDVGGATPVGGFVFAGKSATLEYVNIGDEKNPNWVISSFQNKAGDVYTWSNEKKWYANNQGSEYDQAGFFDIYNWGSRQFGKPLSEAAKNVFEGEPLKDTREAYSQYKSTGGGLGVLGFVGTGIKEGLSSWWSDLTAGGNRSSQALISFWQFSASAGVPGENLPRLLTTTDGYLLGSVTLKLPFSLKVQRFGAMSLARQDYWGPTLFGSSKWAARRFNAILPEWNNLSVYTTGVIPKGTQIKLGITGPQGWRYPGGLFQFQVQSRRVLNQTTKIVTGKK